MLDRVLKYILSALQVHLLLMSCAIHLLLSTIHHFRIGKRSGLSGLIGFVHVFRLKDESINQKFIESILNRTNHPAKKFPQGLRSTVKVNIALGPIPNG
jgi:hypothetical protein